MGTYEELKAAIQQVIRTNGNNEITGALLQNALLSIVNVVGANATFAGIATPNTNPGTADQNVFYLATEAGTYVNFGGIEINMGEAVILSNKTGNWVKTTSGFATQQQLTELESNVGQKDISAELELIQSNAFISDLGNVTSNNNFSIQKVTLKAGMSVILKQDSSQYVAVFSELVRGAYKVISVGTQPKIYLAKEDKDIYISVANTHTINFSFSDVAESAFNANVAASQSQEILQTESWRLADEIIVAENSLMDTGGGIIANAAFDVCQVMIKKGDKVKITAAISSYLAVFAKKIRGERIVLLVGSGNKTYEYVADYSGILVYTKPKASEGLYILRSPISEVAYVGNPLYGKKILCLGDSITEFKYDGMGYPDWIRLKTGAEVYCCGIGGTRISARQATVDAPSTSVEAYAALDIVNIVGALCSGNWSKQIAAAEWLKNNTADDNTAIVQMLSTLNIKSFDYITILAGTNDWTSNYAFGDSNPFGKNAPYYVNSAINRIAYDLSINAPLAKLVAFTPLVRYADQRVDSQWSDVAKNRNRTLAEFSLKLMQEWRSNHIPCGDLYWGMGWNRHNFPAFFLSDDNVHPFQGFEQIADKIIGYLNSDLSNDNELAYLFAQREAIYSVLGMTGIYEYPTANVIAENSMIDAYGGVSTNNGWTIKSISVTKGDVVRLNQGTSIYVSVFAKKNGDKYIPLVVGKGGLIFYEYVADYDGDLYYSLPDGYDDISVVHSDFLAK